MVDSIDRGFSVDVLSLKDVTGIFTGTAAPNSSSQPAPQGSLYLRNTGEVWIKFGANDADWERIENQIALNNTFIADQVVTSTNINQTGGALVQFGQGINQGTGNIASYDTGTDATTINSPGTYNIILNGNAILGQSKNVAVYLEIYVDDISVGIISNTATGSNKNDILSFAYEGIRSFTAGQTLKVYGFRNNLNGSVNPIADQFSLTLEFLG